MQYDTIAAIATAFGSSALSVVRISGKDAFRIAGQICTKDINQSSLREMTLNRLHFLNSDKIFDEVLICRMAGPNSFTGEDTVEFFCHGGNLVAKTLLSELIRAGCRMAEAGEFSRRAFLNGKMDLIKAEGIADIIDAKTQSALSLAAQQMEGALSQKIEALRNDLLLIAAHLAAILDFPEEGVPDITFQEAEERTNSVIYRLESLLKTAEQGIIIHNGLNTVLVGTPNVGKSSLLNALLKEDRAIVTNIPGTTRDVLRERANIGGYLINLSDTAGIRGTEDTVEKFGVERSIQSIKKAHLVLLLLDGSRPLDEEDLHLLKLTEGKKRIIVISKSDLPPMIIEGDISVSAKSGEGLNDLCDKIAHIAASYEPSDNDTLLTNERQKGLVLRVVSLLKGIPFSDLSLDLILGEIEAAIAVLGEISGQNVREDIIDAVFSNFCVGK